MTFKIGQRVAFQNLGYINLGTVREEPSSGRYLVTWDDGFDDEEEFWLHDDATYSAGPSGLQEVH